MNEKTQNDKILDRAHKRFEEIVSSEAENRRLMLDDMRFRAGSPDNGWQWPESIRRDRQNAAGGARPCLTNNHVEQQVLKVVNDIRQNKPALKFIPADDMAADETAEMLNDMVRRIQYESDADTAYGTAVSWAATCGVGYIRVLTEYEDSGFNQEIRIDAITNMFTVYLPESARNPSAADAEYAFITDFMKREDFEAKYPGHEPTSWDGASYGDAERWYTEDSVRVAEYWEKETKEIMLRQYADGTTGQADADDAELHGPVVAERKSVIPTVTCYTLCGHDILDTAVWAGKYIPIARVIGNEYMVEGKLHYSGMMRNAKDAQRMINYWDSQEAEMLALAPKAPFIGAFGQFQGHEAAWNAANQSNVARLEYNPVVDSDMGPIQVGAPQRQMPPMVSNSILEAKRGAVDSLKAVTGQYDASLGRQGNETSGKAIVARQRQGDISAYHYTENLSKAIRHVGRIILDILPSIMDTPRTARTITEDGTHGLARIEPDLPGAYAGGQDGMDPVYNLRVGKYDVMAVTGQSYSTKRQEAADGMIGLTQASPALWPVIGDLLVKSLDWPGATEMSERLKRLVPPQALGEGGGKEAIPPQAKQMLDQSMSQIEQLTQALTQAQDQMEQQAVEKEIEKAKLALESRKLDIEQYKAETDRMLAMQKAVTMAEGMPMMQPEAVLPEEQFELPLGETQ